MTTKTLILMAMFLPVLSFATFPRCKEKKTSLSFYIHESYLADNRTSVLVAGQNKNGTNFGDIFVFDDIIRKGPEPSSKAIGFAQGTAASASRTEFASLLQANWGFVEGKYSGSWLTVSGRNTLGNFSREVSVVGGIGKFRLARGYALYDTVYFDPLAGIILHLNVTVFTPTCY